MQRGRCSAFLLTPQYAMPGADFSKQCVSEGKQTAPNFSKSQKVLKSGIGNQIAHSIRNEESQ